MSHHTYLADFNGYPIEIIDRNGKPWLTGEQIGLALGLKHPRRGINKIFNAHRDEFTPEMTTVTETVTVTGPKETRIFSPRGAWMLGMWCQTERAKAFRVWVLDVLERRQEDPALVESYHALREQYVALIDRHQRLADLVRRADRSLARIERYAALGLSNYEIGRLLGRSESWVRRRRRELGACGLIRQALPAPQQAALPLEGGAS